MNTFLSVIKVIAWAYEMAKLPQSIVLNRTPEYCMGRLSALYGKDRQTQLLLIEQWRTSLN